jgi:uncharacterized protein (DUF952 family)
MGTQSQLIYHLAPAGYFNRQPENSAYRPESLADEGFIHCTGGLDTLLDIANAFFVGLADDLLALEIDPTRLTAPLKFEPPIPPVRTNPATFTPDSELLFPHIYGPLNRQAITRTFVLQRDAAGKWQLPPITNPNQE